MSTGQKCAMALGYFPLLSALMTAAMAPAFGIPVKAMFVVGWIVGQAVGSTALGIATRRDG